MMGKEKEEQDNGKRESNDMKWKQDVGQVSK